MGIAAERIDRLEELARAATAEGDEERAREYVRLARRIAERNRLRLPRTFRRRTCDRCNRYLRPGRNARVRLRDGHVVVTCECGAHARYPYEGRTKAEDGDGRWEGESVEDGGEPDGDASEDGSGDRDGS